MKLGLLYVIGGIFLSASLAYMSARILFPDMGLGVPEYHKFLIVSAVTVPLFVLFQVTGYVVQILGKSK